MAILLVVLKIIGVVLLIPVSLIILIALLLCVPIKYNAVIRYADNLTCSAKITYFLRIISLTVTYNDKELRTVLKIFGCRLGKKNRKTGSKKVNKNYGEETTHTDFEADSDKGEHTGRRVKDKRSKTKKQNLKGGKKSGKPGKKTVLSQINYIKKLIDDNSLKKIIAVTWKYLKKLMKVCLPVEFKTVCRIGFDDPYVTGVLLATAYPVIGLLGLVENVVLIADPDKREFNLKTSIKGKLYVIKIVVLICMYLLSKPIRPLVIQYFFGKDDAE